MPKQNNFKINFSTKDFNNPINNRGCIIKEKNYFIKINSIKFYQEMQ